MLTDAFFRRYEDVSLFDFYTESERRFCGQMSQLLTAEVHKRNEKAYKERDSDPATKGLALAHERIARELGVTGLSAKHFNYTVGVGDYKRTQRGAYLIESLIQNYFDTPPTENTSID